MALLLCTSVLAGGAAQAADPYNPQTWQLDLIKANAAYQRGFTGANVTVAVGDTGFDTSHIALASRFVTALGRNYLVLNGGAYNPSDLSVEQGQTFDIHGTHVAGIIAAAKINGVQMHGVAYDAKIIPIRTVIENKIYSYAPGIDGDAAPLNYFASLRDVMIYNASYGPSREDGAPQQSVWANTMPSSQAEVDAVASVLRAGKIIVAAAGNGRTDDPIAGKNPSGIALYPYIAPAHDNTGVYSGNDEHYDLTSFQNLPGQIISVMAITPTKAAAEYSQLCGVTASWCVAAPGGQLDAQGAGGVISTIPYSDYKGVDGTSMAAPAVSGALAVLIQANPTYNAQDLSRLLFSTTEDLGLPGIDKTFGQGLIRLDRATDTWATVVPGGSISVAANDTTYWSQLLNIAGGGFTKTGDGILTISGRTNAGGDVVAQQGTLAVDGTLTIAAGSQLNVTQPATLAGFGWVAGNTSIAGTLSPGKMANYGDLVANGSIAAGTVLAGNSVGALTFNGNVTLTSTANMRIDIDGALIVPGGPGTYDKIYVTGAGNVFYAGGTLTPVFRGTIGTVSNYTPNIGATFAIVQAENGASTAGHFATVVQPTASLPSASRLDIIYEPSAITLAVTPASFTALAETGQLSPTQRFVAGLLDRYRAAINEAPAAGVKSLYDALYKLDSEAQYDKALAQLGGPGQPAVTSAPMQAFTGFMSAIGDRQDTLAFGGEAGQSGTAQNFALSYAGRSIMSAETSAAMSAFASIAPSERVQQGWSVWGQGFGRSSRVGDSGDLSGSKSVSAGFTMGADRRFSNTLIAGGAIGYARTTSSSTDMSGSSDTYAGAAYASWTPGAAVIDMRIAAGPSQMSSSRQTVLSSTSLQGSTNGVGIGTSLEAGYRFALTPDLVLKPYAGLTWQGFRRGAYSESQLPIGLVYAAQTYDKLTSVLGAALSARLRTTDGLTLMPELKLGWGYDLRDSTLVSQAALLDQPFAVSAAQPGRSAALLGAKVSGWRSENFRMFTAYNGEFRSNATSHQLSAGARFNW